jgi:Tol biopolymer transport system component
MRRGIWVVAAIAALALAAPAQAAFPGQNGKIAFSDKRDDPNPSGCHPNCNYEIYSVNPDGTGVSRLTNHPGPDVRPAWSPNGQRIVFNRYSPEAEIVVMGANGEAPTSLGPGLDPSWSAEREGSKIVFVAIGECGAGTGGIWTMNADGTGRRFIACGPPGIGEDGEGNPVWSPDGRLIAFGADLAEFDIFTVQPDGANRTNLTTSPNDIDRNANWSPDGASIAWGRDQFTGEAIWTMNRDGTGKAQLISGASDPAWSPDGTRIVVNDLAAGLRVYNANGTGGALVTSGVEPDWQPLPEAGYPRPKGATPTLVSLTIAYEQCTNPDRIHGPPLVYDSCSNPQMASAFLTVGTGDSNGRPAHNDGHVRLSTRVGNAQTPADEADVAIEVFSDDIFTKALDDYIGELRARVPLRITDRDTHFGGQIANVSNTTPIRVTTSAPHLMSSPFSRVTLVGSAAPCANADAQASWHITIDSPTSFTLNGSTGCGSGPGGTWLLQPGGYPGTVVDLPLEFAVPCTPVAEPRVGSACTLSTTVDALIPGAVEERKRSIWQLGQIEVYDGGPDGDADTPTGDTLFATQGLFVP